jgi:sulfite reductase (ferredoxin)
VRGQGQWALGYREPLNANEQPRKDSSPLSVRERHPRRLQQERLRSIDGGDLRGRFRWFGLYTSGPRGIPGGKDRDPRAPRSWEAPFFMLRVRIDGGQLTGEQLRTIGARLATAYGRDVADVTEPAERPAALDPHRGRPGHLGAARRVGWTPPRPCGDCPRVIVGCPLAGVDGDEVLDASGVLEEVRARYIGDPAFSNLPRKFKTSISGCSVHCTNHEINDVSFVGVRLPDGRVGYDLWVGGGLSTNPKLACGWACSWSRSGSPRSGPASRRCSATTATAARGCTPG